ncbi:MAG: hypothetical protein LBJ79_03170, partial [Endomicrobium sp.]|nr:hypothetical protein [Endomicrobium sp.]
MYFKGEIKRYRVVRVLVILCLIIEICSYAIVAAQEIRINGVVDHEVYGNGGGEDGSLPVDAAIEPSNNRVDIEGAAGVSYGDVVGGRDRGPGEDVVSNRVVIDIAAGWWGGEGEGEGIIGGDVCGGRAQGDAIRNKVTIKDGTI